MAAPAKTPPKVGLMVPINNTTMERELLAWLPAGSLCTTLRIPRGKGLLTPEAMPAYKAQTISLVAAFADLDIDVVAYGCTAAGFIAGPARRRRPGRCARRVAARCADAPKSAGR